MAVTLPHLFDTSAVWRVILKGAFALEAVILVGVLYRALVSQDAAAVLQLTLIAAMLAFFIRLFVRFQTGSIGTLTAERVVLQPNKLYGLRLPGPQGEYGISRFSRVRVELMSGLPGLNAVSDMVVQGGPHERIWLVGKDGTSAILIARTDREAGRALAREFGTALGLPVEETRRPY